MAISPGDERMGGGARLDAVPCHIWASVEAPRCGVGVGSRRRSHANSPERAFVAGPRPTRRDGNPVDELRCRIPATPLRRPDHLREGSPTRPNPDGEEMMSKREHRGGGKAGVYK